MTREEALRALDEAQDVLGMLLAEKGKAQDEHGELGEVT